jgi:hypothetical protein
MARNWPGTCTTPGMIRALALSLCLALLSPGLAAAQDCARLAAQAGADAGLPDGLLPAIALVESGRGTGRGGIAPWPWTLNQGGKGMYFDTREEALAYLKQAVAEGVTNIDVGCMQLNWKWHSAGFASPEDMIDPARNTRYAARFMVELYNRLGSWDVAAAAYHSTTPERGQRYLQKVLAARDSFRAQPPLPGATADGAPDGAGEGTLLLTAIPTQLDGILAHAGSPLFAIAAAPPADGFTGETPSDDPSVAAPPAAAPAVIAAADRPPPARPGGTRTDGTAHRKPPPDLPMVIAAATTRLALPENLPPRLRHRWAEVEAMRAILSDAP